MPNVGHVDAHIFFFFCTMYDFFFFCLVCLCYLSLVVNVSISVFFFVSLWHVLNWVFYFRLLLCVNACFFFVMVYLN